MSRDRSATICFSWRFSVSRSFKRFASFTSRPPYFERVYFNIRLNGERQCILMILGATDDGRKELLAIGDGFGEDAQSWKELILELRARGLEGAPELAVGDGALGFWQAVAELWPETRHQRCWVHKTANLLSKLPKSAHGAAKAEIHEIWMAETRELALAAFKLFGDKYRAK